MIKMDQIFNECSNLKRIFISNFNNNDIINLKYFFSLFKSLEKINISNFTANN